MHLDTSIYTSTWGCTWRAEDKPSLSRACLSSDSFITSSGLLYNQHQSLLSHPPEHYHHKHTGPHTLHPPTHTITHSGQLSDVRVCISPLLVLKWVIYPSTASLQPARANTISHSLCLYRWRGERDRDIQYMVSEISLFLPPPHFALPLLLLHLYIYFLSLNLSPYIYVFNHTALPRPPSLELVPAWLSNLM